MTRSEKDVWRFAIESDSLPDALLRLLNPFEVQGAHIRAVEHRQTKSQSWTMIEVGEIDVRRAGVLQARLLRIPSVVSVDLDPNVEK